MHMSFDGLGIHHRAKRKRHDKLRRLFMLDNSRVKKEVDRFAYISGVLTPLFAIPQLLEIWLGQTTEGVSTITWTAYIFISLFWTFYGIVHREKPIILMYASQAFVQVFIIWGIILYR